MSGYSCKSCGFSTPSLKAFTTHVKVHRNVANYSFACGVAECPCTFKRFSAFKSHVYRHHTKLKPTPTEPENVTLSCQVERCTFQTTVFSCLCAHLRWHIRDGKKVSCPYTGCTKYFRVKSTFTSHLSRNHKHSVANSEATNRHSLADNQKNTQSTMSDETVSEVDLGLDCTLEGTVLDQSQFLSNLALFYLKMQAKMLLPASTIQTIIEEFQEVHSSGMKCVLSKLHEKLSTLKLQDSEISEIIDEVSQEDLFKACNEGALRSDKTRKSYFKKTFSYVEPTQIYLGSDATGKERFCQYVPIKETLKSLFSQSAVRDQYRQAKMPKPNSDADVLEDVTDGKNIKENPLLQESPSSLSIVLYQDSFEVANPLGSGKKKHKILAVYLTLGEILPHHRSCIDPMQLVLLCREEDFKFFGQEKLFSSLVSDLKDIEEIGFETVDGNTLKGSLIAISGDNLGSHCIGGFTENFSRSNYFCRYCLIDRRTFEREPENMGPKRTVNNYKDSVEQLGDQDMVNGIKFDSVFNDLKHFHVCKPGLPPCLGHDLFEGIVSYDLAMYIKHLVTVEKHFTYVQLNRCISQFRYSGSDSNNRPCDIKADGEKLGGHAVQNWCFLRLLPLYIGDRIKDPVDNEVWQLCLKLRAMVELICAPKINHGQIAYLKILIEEYVHLRHTMFPDRRLKPKHHFLLHYPDLILHFGPLIRLWTLRFESKHSYFKQCARKLHNFKNLCSTLAERHQLLQAFLSTGQLFSPNIQVVGLANNFDGRLFNDGVQQALRTMGNRGNTTEVSAILYKNTKYCKGLVVVVDENDHGLIFGKIVLILICQSRVHLIVEKHQSVPLVDLGVHCLTAEAHYVCVDIDNLADYYPLPQYDFCGVSVVALHHSICL